MISNMVPTSLCGRLLPCHSNHSDHYKLLEMFNCECVKSMLHHFHVTMFPWQQQILQHTLLEQFVHETKSTQAPNRSNGIKDNVAKRQKCSIMCDVGHPLIFSLVFYFWDQHKAQRQLKRVNYTQCRNKYQFHRNTLHRNLYDVLFKRTTHALVMKTNKNIEAVDSN